MIYILLLILVYCLGYTVGKNKKPLTIQTPVSDLRDSKSTIRSFLLQFKKRNPSQASNHTIHAQIDFLENWIPDNENSPPIPSHTTPTALTPPAISSQSKTELASVLKKPINSTAILLYFGAFLFITSMGLFVGFSDVNGLLKTLCIGLVSFVLYFGGLHLHKREKRLREASIAFVGIGMAIAPLIGLAAYIYIFNENNGAAVWLITSIGVFALYLHALFLLRNTIVSYLLIFSFVSLFQSAVAVVNAPVYYFSWALALSGMTLQLLSLRIKSWPELEEPSSLSSLALIAITITVSTLTVGNQGIGQLCASLFIATLYSAISIRTGNRMAERYIATHVLALATIGTTVFYLFNDISAVTYAFCIATIFEAALIWNLRKLDTIKSTFASVSIVAVFIAGFLGISNSYSVLAALTSLLLVALITAYKQNRVDAFAIGSLAWLAIPSVFGQLVISERLPIQAQTALTSFAIIPNALFLLHAYKSKLTPPWIHSAETQFASALCVAIGSSLFGSSILVAITASGITIAAAAMSFLSRHSVWSAAAGIIPFTALLVLGLRDNSNTALLLMTFVALVSNISLTLYSQQSINRWLSTTTWLILPAILGIVAFPVSWNSEMYAWSYVIVMVILLVSLSIARGTLLHISWSSMASLTREASIMYIIGAAIAGVIAFVASFDTENVVLHSSLIAAAVGACMTVGFRNLEGRHEAGVIPPLTIQVILFCAFRIYDQPEHPNAYIFASSMSALAGYGAIVSDGVGTFKRYFSQASLVTLYVAPFSLFIFALSLSSLHAIGLIIAGIASLHYVRKSSQTSREIAGAVILMGICLLMYYFGVRNIQAYSHMVTLLFALYAYWRTLQADEFTSKQYIYLALASATIPLVAQALSSEGGGLYGVWLLIEMIVIMLTGIAIHNRTVTLWGLYVSVGAVLYQIRDLGWAMLALLAMFIIGIAVYKSTREK